MIRQFEIQDTSATYLRLFQKIQFLADYLRGKIKTKKTILMI